MFKFFLLLGLTVYFPCFAREVLRAEQFSVGGKGTSVLEVRKSFIKFDGSGENWLSTSIEITTPGVFQIETSRQGDTKRVLLIDGETLDSVSQLSSSKYLTTSPLPAVRLDKGRHSISFYAPHRSANKHEVWSKIELTRLAESAPAIDLRNSWRPLGTHAQALRIGSLFDGTYINVNIAREKALFTHQDYQYLSYFHPEGFLVVARRKLTENHFEKYWLPISEGKLPIAYRKGTISLSNPHHYISMEMDGAGYLHVAFGQHSNRMNYLRSQNPYDISRWNLAETNILPGPQETKVTYPSFIRTQGGDLLLHFRSGTAGKGEEHLYRYLTPSQKWEPLYSPFIVDNGKSSPYFWHAATDPRGVIHLAWTWRLNGVQNYKSIKARGFKNADVSYAKSSDEGRTWQRSDGSSYVLPIQRTGKSKQNAEVIKKIAMGESFFNHYGSDIDSAGHPHFVFTKWESERSHIAQHWHLFWDGKTWQSQVASDYEAIAQWSAGQCHGQASTDIARPNLVLNKEGRALIFSRALERNQSIEAFVSEAPYELWKTRSVFDGSTGGWEPQLDRTLWHREAKLQFILLGVTDAAVEERYRAPKLQAGFWSKTNPLFRNLFQSSANATLCPDAPPAKPFSIDSRLTPQTGYIMEVLHESLKP